MRIILILSALYGATGVLMGAFAAHGLKKLVSPAMVEVVDTGVRYQLIHAVALLALVALAARLPSPWVTAGAWLMVVGVLFFSGSLYLLGLTGIKFFGPITPLGGLLLVLGWLSLLVAALKENL
ncbi:DUF423 domain-containing protein [Gallaecimonas xiamenensis]|uniref:DUF423 domain-containing protein n=1 Tax=Gallaecimonas xiamenensis 3-C-1 TaxID=745411 RepID=K2JZ88_9GAMM|nr:DUF423 domain-containing protein [Gallaecimonas xiamenensis]EKE70600.1 hypothetical protein B3C1_13718 [Gallaecimonas xiamenensis 3-C-1]